MTDNYLAKYHPEMSILDQFEVKAGLPPNERAFEAWGMLVRARKLHESSFLIIGKLLKIFRDEKLYEKLDYENFGQFLESEEISFSREKAYMCIKTYEYYIEYLELDPEVVGKMNISRLALMVPLLKKAENREEAIKQIEAMSSLRHGDFMRDIKSKTNREGKPSCYWSEEEEKWMVSYYPSITLLKDLGEFV